MTLLFLPFLLLASDAGSLVTAGDEQFILVKYPAALETYQRALQQNPNDAAVLWRLARVCVCMGEVMEEPAAAQPLFRRAEEYARQAIASDSLLAEGHTWLAGALGYLALDAPMGDQVRLSHELLDETGRALRLNPSDDGALSIRGSFYRALGNVGWLKRQLASLLLGSIPDGGFPEAEAALLRAIAIAPDVMRHRYELGVLYLDWGRREDAREALTRACALPIRTAIDRPRKEKALRLVSELGGEKEQNRP